MASDSVAKITSTHTGLISTWFECQLIRANKAKVNMAKRHSHRGYRHRVCRLWRQLRLYQMWLALDFKTDRLDHWRNKIRLTRLRRQSKQQQQRLWCRTRWTLQTRSHRRIRIITRQNGSKLRVMMISWWLKNGKELHICIFILLTNLFKERSATKWREHWGSSGRAWEQIIGRRRGRRWNRYRASL